MTLRHLLAPLLAAALCLAAPATAEIINVSPSGGSSFDPASPGAIGGTTPAVGTFTTVNASSVVSSGAVSGTTVTGSGVVQGTNLTATSAAAAVNLPLGGVITWSTRTKLTEGGQNGNLSIFNNATTVVATVGIGATSNIFNIGGINLLAPTQTILSHAGCRPSVDSNCAAPDFIIQSGVTTGTATPSAIIFRSSAAAIASGSTAQTYVTSFTIKGGLPIRPSSTVAALPACAAATTGGMAWVTDASATTFLSTVTSGGANKVPVSCDGANWVIG